MDGRYIPTALYHILAISVAIKARFSTESTGKLFRIKSWKKWLLHVPVGAAWFHLLCYMFWQLLLNDWPPEAFDRINMIIHTAMLTSLGIAGGWIYCTAIQAPLQTDTALKSSTSDAAPQADEPE